jgi:hypothetical protein
MTNNTPQRTIIIGEFSNRAPLEMQEAAVRLRLFAQECFVKSTSTERIFRSPHEVENLIAIRGGIVSLLGEYERFKGNHFYDPNLVTEVKGYLKRLQ